MEILERGTPPEEREYNATCRNCKSLLRFKRSEAKYHSTCRNESYLEVQCPVCRLPIYHEITFTG